MRSKASGIKNPITGEYIELKIQLTNKDEFNKKDFISFLSKKLTPQKMPSSIKIGSIKLSHRMKQS
mgnify:CR=1 FL=1